MSDKIVAIISTGEAGKARTGLAFALNALNKGWLEEVRLVLFGPAEELLLRDLDLQSMVREFQSSEGAVVACKAVADREGISERIAAAGVPVEFVGKKIADLMRDGYVPMVW